MLPFILAAVLLGSPSPSPAATPLRTIVHERVYPICKVLRENVAHAIQALLADDQAIDASRPLILSMAKHFGSIDTTNQAGWGDLHHAAHADHDTASMELDTQHLEQIIGALTHNAALIRQQLSDPSLFPAVPSTSSGRQALQLKAQSETVLDQQQKLVNVLEGLLDTRETGTLASRGDPLDQLFGTDHPSELSAAGNLTPLSPGPPNQKYASSKTSGGNAVFSNGGPLTQTQGELSDPQLSQSDVTMLANNIFGRFYWAIYLQQARIRSVESPLALRVIETTKECKSSP